MNVCGEVWRTVDGDGLNEEGEDKGKPQVGGNVGSLGNCARHDRRTRGRKSVLQVWQ